VQVAEALGVCRCLGAERQESRARTPNDNAAAKGLREWWLLPRDPACSAYRATYGLFITQPTLSRRIGRLMFAAAHLFLPLARALPSASQPSLPAEALDDFPGDARARVLKLVG